MKLILGALDSFSDMLSWCTEAEKAFTYFLIIYKCELNGVSEWTATADWRLACVDPAEPSRQHTGFPITAFAVHCAKYTLLQIRQFLTNAVRGRGKGVMFEQLPCQVILTCG